MPQMLFNPNKKKYLFWLDDEKGRPILSFMNVDTGKQLFDRERKYFIWKYNYCYENSLDTLGKSDTQVIWALQNIACRWVPDEAA